MPEFQTCLPSKGVWTFRKADGFGKHYMDYGFFHLFLHPEGGTGKILERFMVEGSRDYFAEAKVEEFSFDGKNVSFKKRYSGTRSSGLSDAQTEYEGCFNQELGIVLGTWRYSPRIRKGGSVTGNFYLAVNGEDPQGLLGKTILEAMEVNLERSVSALQREFPFIPVTE